MKAKPWESSMNVLVLGGTQFVGRHITEALRAAGHSVTTLTRGVTPDELPADVERLRGDRDQGVAGIASLQRRRWDVCIDVSGYTAVQVRSSAELLRNSVDRYVFISAVSVYGDPTNRPVREDHPRLPPEAEHVTEVNRETYGRLKVICENIVEEVFGERCTLLRPQILVGPHDPTERYSYWVQRVAQGGEMLAPGDGTDHVQVLDIRDFAKFTVTVVEKQLHGAFSLAGPRITWTEFMSVLGAKNVVWVPACIIRAAGLTESELPLYREERGERSGLMDVSNERALAAGLTLAEPRRTMLDMRAWLAGRSVPLALSPEREQELIGMTQSHAALRKSV